MKPRLTPSLSWERAFWLLLIVLAVTFCALTARIHVFLAGDPVTQFAPEVVGLLGGQGLTAFAIDPYRGPLFPTLVAGVAWALRGNIFGAGQVVEVAAYVLFVVATFGVIQSSFNAKLACLTALTAGALAPVLMNGLAWLTDILFVALALSSLWCMLAGQKYWAWAALGAGVLAGLAFDTRWNGVFLLGAAVFAAMLNPWRLPRSRVGLWLLLFIAGGALAAAPWLAINNALHGSPFYNALNQVPMEATLLSPRLGPAPSLRDLILGDPAFFFPRYFSRLLWTGLLQVSQIVPTVLALFIPAGALLLLRQLDRRQALLLAFSGVFWSIAALTHFEARYYFPLLPLLLVLPLYFLLSPVVPDRRLPYQASLKLCLLAVLLIGLSVDSIQKVQEGAGKIEVGFEPQLEAAHLLATQQHSGAAGTRVAVGWFSGARFFIPRDSGLPIGTLRPPEQFLHLPAGFSHIFVEEAIPARDGVREFPASLFEPLTAGDQLEALYYKSVKPRAVLYQVMAANHVWPLQAVIVSPALDADHGPPAVLDADSQSGWLTPPASAPTAPATLTADLGQVVQVNHIWLLPPPNSLQFPESYRLETSPDGAAWTLVAQVDAAALNQRQNPQMFAFAALPARFVRFTALRLRTNPAGQYQAGLNALRISLTDSLGSAKP